MPTLNNKQVLTIEQQVKAYMYNLKDNHPDDFTDEAEEIDAAIIEAIKTNKVYYDPLQDLVYPL